MAQVEVQRAYRVALDPTRTQMEALKSHAGASRAAYNYHLAAKVEAHRRYTQERAWATYTDHAELDPDTALTAAKKTAATTVRFPTYMDSIKVFCADPDKAWRDEVNRYALTSGMRAADAAWKNWVDSTTGRRAGAKVGYPRFHAKGRSKDSFTLYHDVKKATLRPDGYRRLNLPALVGGSIRLHGNLRHLARRITRGTAVIASVTISRGGRHWYASILARETITVPDAPTRRQQAGGVVGVDVGVNTLAALSTGELVPNPRHLRKAQTRLIKAQRVLSRTKWRLDDGTLTAARRRGVKAAPTSGRQRAKQRLARAHADLAQARATTIHALTKTLATTHAVIAIEDLNVKGMTASARGSVEAPGVNVAAKAGLNRSILDASFGEIRRCLAYKAAWCGSTLVVTNRWAPTSRTCSSCGLVKAKLGLGEREFHCTRCGHRQDRDINAARNIAAAARVLLNDASGNGESQNADRDPDLVRQGGALTSEGQEPPGHRPPPPRNRRPTPNHNTAAHSRRSGSVRPA